MRSERNYIDCFLFPIATDKVDIYKGIATEVAGIWKEHGALEYFEFLGDDLSMPGLKAFDVLLETAHEESIIFGFATFHSREDRDRANQLVSKDPRMGSLVAPLMTGEKKIFEPERMVFGGFKKLFGR